jgi:peptidyl-prolyl cis-trans isomerase A (cyclophilin A)
MRSLRLFVPVLLTLAVACGETEAPAPPPEPAKEAPAKEAPERKEAAKDGPDSRTALPADAHPALTDPSKATKTAPDEFKVKFETTKGDFVVAVHKAWAPNGADRLYNLVDIGYFDHVAFFRAIDGFMVQYGISGYPEVNTAWRDATIPDDPVVEKNTRGRMTFATRGPNSRTTQVFINYADRNVNLDGMGFAPFGEIVSGMDVVDSLYKGYGEGAPRGRGPSQGLMQEQGNSYLLSSYPQLDYVLKASIVER